MLEKVKDIPPEILIVNENRKQWLRNHPDFGAFLEQKIRNRKLEKNNVKCNYRYHHET